MSEWISSIRDQPPPGPGPTKRPKIVAAAVGLREIAFGIDWIGTAGMEHEPAQWRYEFAKFIGIFGRPGRQAADGK